MTVRMFIPGEDHTEQLNHVAQAMKDLRSEKRRGLYDYPGGDDEYSEALEVLVDERRRLAALPQRPAAWVDVETGETFADAWTQADQESRRQLLIGLKARRYMAPAIEGWYLPTELDARVRLVVGGGSEDDAVGEWRQGHDVTIEWGHIGQKTFDPGGGGAPLSDQVRPSDPDLRSAPEESSGGDQLHP